MNESIEDIDMDPYNFVSKVIDKQKKEHNANVQNYGPESKLNLKKEISQFDKHKSLKVKDSTNLYKHSNTDHIDNKTQDLFIDFNQVGQIGKSKFKGMDQNKSFVEIQRTFSDLSTRQRKFEN